MLIFTSALFLISIITLIAVDNGKTFITLLLSLFIFFAILYLIGSFTPSHTIYNTSQY